MSWGKGAENNSIGWGQGDNNSIGWGLRHLDSWSGDTALYGVYTDPDAQAFITAASITDPTQQSAVNQLVLDLKDANIWTKMKRIYPMIGGTADKHKYCLKSLTNGTFYGGWIHNSQGSQGNGTTAYFDTGLSPFSLLIKDSNSIGYYNRNASPNSGYHGVGTPNWFLLGNWSNDIEYYPNSSTSTLVTVAKDGLIVGTRRGASEIEMYRNGLSIVTNTNPSQNLPSNNFWFGGTNNGNSLSFALTHQLAFAFLGDGLNDTEAANLYTAVQTFQTTLGRNV